MKSFYNNSCNLCEDRIQVGDEIARFLGKYVHVQCKQTQIDGFKTVVTIPQVTLQEKPQQIRPKRTYGDQRVTGRV